MHPFANTAIKAATEAGKLILRSVEHRDRLVVQSKGPHDYATRVDELAEETIKQIVLKAYPKHCILGEESGETINEDGEVTWIIDPLDGTTNFIHGIPHFAVSIAVKFRGKIEHGVIYDPMRNELFVATRGDGAQLNGRRIRIGNKQKPETSVIATGFPFRQQLSLEKYLEQFQKVYGSVDDIRRSGSAALDLAYVAAGRFGGFFEYGLYPWDIAAGSLIVREAGGYCNAFSGENEDMPFLTFAGGPKTFDMLKNALDERP